MRAQSAIDTYKGWPKWAGIGGPVLVGLIAIGAISGCSDEPSSAPPTTAVVAFASIDDALEAAEIDVSGVSDAEIGDLIEQVCDGGTADAVAKSVVDLVSDSTQAKELLEGAGDGAEIYCPEAVADDPQLLNDAYGATVTLLRAQAPPTTVRPTTTTTTAPPPPTTAPPTTAPPTTQAAPPPPPPPAPTSAYYANCDAARAAGAAPLYAGEPGYRSGLDRDGDGVACET
jgi:hypothetical protein